MTEEIEQKDQEENEELTCPECGKEFQDMRGLTSHARHIHEITREGLNEMLKRDDKSPGWKMIGSLGVFLLTVITLGKMR